MADAAAYRCELDSNRQLHLSNEGAVTAVTLTSSRPGQQQQSSNHFTTGQWTAAPVLYRLDQGLLIVVSAASTYYLQLCGSQVQMLSGSLSEQVVNQLQQAQPVTLQRDDRAKTVLEPVQSMTPMQPMTPMRMQNPMSLSMGDMKMTMGKSGAGEMSLGDMQLGTQPSDLAESSSTASAAGTSSQGSIDTAKTRRFCSQCGAAVTSDDRFCAYCGTKLN